MYEQLLACHDTIREFAMNEPINALFAACVLILEVIGEWTGMGYELANIVIFIALQPGLILLSSHHLAAGKNAELAILMETVLITY